MHYLYTFQPWSHVLTVQAMLAHGAGLNEVDNTGKPLWYRNWLCPEKLRLYLERGVDPNEIHFDASGKPYLLPLMATARGSITAGADVAGSLHLLLDYGANIDAQDTRGYTALHHAVECDQFSLAFLLLERGADYSVKSNTSPEETALDILLRRSGGPEYEREQLTRMLVSYKDRATMLASTASIEATTRGKSRL